MTCLPRSYACTSIGSTSWSLAAGTSRFAVSKNTSVQTPARTTRKRRATTRPGARQPAPPSRTPASPADIPYHAGTRQPAVILRHGYSRSATASRTHTAVDGLTSTTPTPPSVPGPQPLSGTRGDKLSATPRPPHCHLLPPGGHASDTRPCPGDELGATPCRHLLPSGGHASDAPHPRDELSTTLCRPPRCHLLPSGGHANYVSRPCPGDELSATSRCPPYHHLLPSGGHASDVALRRPAPSPAHPARIPPTCNRRQRHHHSPSSDSDDWAPSPPSAVPHHPPTAWPGASNGVSTLILTPYSSHLSQWGSTQQSADQHASGQVVSYRSCLLVGGVEQISMCSPLRPTLPRPRTVDLPDDIGHAV